MRRPVTIIRPSVKDRFGDARDRFGDPVSDVSTDDVAGDEFPDTCYWVIGLPSSDDDANGRQNRVSSSVTAYPMGETRVQAADFVRVNGVVWQVDGDPARAESPFTGRLAGHQVSLKRVRG